jgi:Cu2+-exporting ATPase
MIAGAGWHQALLIAVAVLIITCPCALGLAVPVAQVIASGALMRRGILVKDGSALERLAEADCVRLDKTGTVTLGRPQPVGALPLRDDDAGVALALARCSRHPLSLALARLLEEAGVEAAEVGGMCETPGLGVSGEWMGREVRLGSPAWMDAPDPGNVLATAFRIGLQPARVMAFTDQLRPDAPAAAAQLRALGLDPAILSGDREDAVAAAALALEMPGSSGMSPHAKLEAIQALERSGRKVLVVGDGLNDGPALAAGHVSIAPASASDVGQNAADLVFLGDSLLPVPIAVRAARRTQAVVKQNFALAIGYNVLAVPLAILGHVTPLVAAIAMSTSSIVVVANALRLRSCAR